MKHSLLILISLLLLSSFVSSCDIKKDEILYRWKTPSGLEWKRFGDDNVHPRYEGEVLVLSGIFGDYVRSGNGVMVYPFTWIKLPDKYVTSYLNKYVGTWENDEEWNGYGYTMIHPQISFVKFVNGKCLEGVPSSMKPCNGEYYDNDNNILGKIVNGEKVKQ